MIFTDTRKKDSPYFGRDYNVIPVPAKMLDCTSHDFLTFTTRITLCAVKEVDTGVKCSFQASKSVFVANMTAICEPSSERDSRNLETRLADETVFHLRKVLRDLDFLLRHDGSGD